MRLNDKQQRLVEANLGLVGQVIKDKVRDVNRIGLFTYDDLYQIGSVGLCKAAATYQNGRGCFSTYAYRLIRNEIYDALEYATLRRNREYATAPDDLAGLTRDETPDMEPETLQAAMKTALDAASGVTAKGIEAIILLAQGYTNKEIGERMGGASANNVTAWVARARKFLRSRPDIAALGELL
jgi:RNA polymerase sigma factor (sigma-70 family)